MEWYWNTVTLTAPAEYVAERLAKGVPLVLNRPEGLEAVIGRTRVLLETEAGVHTMLVTDLDTDTVWVEPTEAYAYTR